MIHLKTFGLFLESLGSVNEARYFSDRGAAAIAYVLGLEEASDSRIQQEKRFILKKYGISINSIMDMVFGESWKRGDYKIWVADLAQKIGSPTSSLFRISSGMSNAFLKKSMNDPIPDKEIPQYFNDMYDLSIEEIKKIVDGKLRGISDESDLSLDPPFDILEPAKKELSKRTKGIVLWNYPNKEDKTLENIKYMEFDENSTRNMIKIGLRNSGVDGKLRGISDESDLSLDPPFDILEPAKKELSKRTKGIVLWNYPNKEDKTLENIKYMEFDENSTRNMIKIGLRNSGVDLIGYDLIISPKSSSKILPIFIDEIQAEISRQYEKYGISPKIPKISENSFEKLKWKDVEWDWERIEEIKPKAMAALNAEMKRIERRNWDEKVKFQGGPLYRDFRYLISRFMKLTPQGISNVNSARKILIVDDFITGGSTKRQMEKLIKEQNPGVETFSLAIFQIKTSRSENISQENL
jgi:hypothetical protein